MHRVSYAPEFPSAVLREKSDRIGNEALKAGHPSVWKDDQLFEEACLWLNEEIVSLRNSPNTWAQAAQSILTWFDFLEAAGIHWKYAGKADLIAYRDAYLSSVSPQSGREYSANTVAVRMTYIIDFIRFGIEQRWIESDFCSGPIKPQSRFQRISIDQDPLAHIRKNNPRSAEPAAAAVSRLNKLKPKSSQDETVRVLSRQELNAMIRWAGPRPSERQQEDGGSDRDFIVLALGWACGLRVQEIADVSAMPFLSMVPDPQKLGRFFKLSVTGKGKKTLPIDVPAWLVLDIQSYIDGERKRSLRKRGPKVEEKQLVLNSENSTRAGKPMTKGAIQALVNRACIGAGLLTKVTKTNPQTGEVIVVQVAQYSPHCLRHTYAVITYHNHRKYGFAELDAWKYIQMQLRHKSPTTTINTYLRHISVWADYRAGRTLLEMLR